MSSTVRTTWSVDEHLDDILGSIRPLDPIELQLPDAQGCVLVDDVTVPVALPPSTTAPWTGTRCASPTSRAPARSTPAVLTVIGDASPRQRRTPRGRPRAGRPHHDRAPLPPGAEAVVPVEWTDGGAGGGAATHDARRERRPRGGERRGPRPPPPSRPAPTCGRAAATSRPASSALAAGTVLGPAQIGRSPPSAAASVRVRPRPRVVAMRRPAASSSSRARRSGLARSTTPTATP